MVTSRPLHPGLGSALEFRSVSFGFDGKTVLSDIKFHLQHGEMLLLTGESGSGKSILLRLAIGLLHDHSADPYFADPWDKARPAQEKLL